MEASVDVVIVEDHRLTSDTISYLLRERGATTRVVLGTEFATGLRRGEPVDARLVLLDLDLGDGLDGATLIPHLVAAGLRVVVCSAEPAHRLGACLEAGAAGVVRKGGSIEQVIGTLERALAGEPAMSPHDRGEMLAQLRRHRTESEARLGGLADLTPGEADVLRSLADGLSPAGIASARGVSLKTVRHQIESILVKLGVKSQLQAVGLADKAGWLDLAS